MTDPKKSNNTAKPKRSFLARFSAFTDKFAYPLRTSHYVELLNPLWAGHALRAKVVKVWDETKDSRTLTLKPGFNWRGYRAGQHVRIGVPLNGVQYTRTYTISSPPERNDGLFTITVKAIADGRISHHLVRDVKVGSFLAIGLPQGDFYLPDSRPVKPLFITAGSGITPAMSMLESMLAKDRMRDTVHIHYAPHEFDAIFNKRLKQIEIEQPAYNLNQVFTHEYGEHKQTKGYFHAEQLERLCPDWRERETYACGPQPLIEAMEKHFTQEGMLRHLHIERFSAQLAEIPKEAVGGTVSFLKSGIDAIADASTALLRVAEDAGMNPPHGCRMGICHSCSTTLLSGCVRDLRTGKLINDIGSKIQTCVCAAAGNCELDL